MAQRGDLPAITQMLVRALRADAVNVRRPRGTRGRSGAKSIDGAEHSGRLEYVMAAAQATGQDVTEIPTVADVRTGS